MNTVEARSIAEKRIEFMKDYLREFFKEWQWWLIKNIVLKN
jgi:HD superfamily phosphodiesterase